MYMYWYTILSNLNLKIFVRLNWLKLLCSHIYISIVLYEIYSNSLFLRLRFRSKKYSWSSFGHFKVQYNHIPVSFFFSKALLHASIFLLHKFKLLAKVTFKLFVYCESTIVRGVPIFVVFMGRLNHEIWFPTKRRFPLMCILNTSKPWIQESTNMRFFPNPQKLVSTN